MRVGIVVAVTLVALAILMALVQVWLKRLLRSQEGKCKLALQAQAKDHAPAIAVVIVQPDNSISLAAKPVVHPVDDQGLAAKPPAGSLAKPAGCSAQLPAGR
ncbi:hypothetical protein N2152v2_010930 [Parachlorella kessleri]